MFINEHAIRINTEHFYIKFLKYYVAILKTLAYQFAILFYIYYWIPFLSISLILFLYYKFFPTRILHFAILKIIFDR